jgi:hypothetical protein
MQDVAGAREAAPVRSPITSNAYYTTSRNARTYSIKNVQQYNTYLVSGPCCSNLFDCAERHGGHDLGVVVARIVLCVRHCLIVVGVGLSTIDFQDAELIRHDLTIQLVRLQAFGVADVRTTRRHLRMVETSGILQREKQ